MTATGSVTAATTASLPSARQAAGRLSRATVSHGVGFWLVGYAFTVIMAFSATPTPLYVLYARRDHFSSLVVTCVFASYAVGVVASVFLVGHVSDWVGRRRMLMAAVELALAAGLVFMLWTALPALVVARVLSGLAVGIVTTTATAHIAELHARRRPDAPTRHPQLLAGAANLGGIGLGPLVSGLLAQYVQAPLRTPYLVIEGLLLLAHVALASTPETVGRDRSVRYRMQRIAVPVQGRPAFFAAAAGAGALFAVFGLFSALVPSFLADTMHEQSHAVAGAVASLVFLASAAAQLVRGRDQGVTRTVGVITAGVGMAMVTAATWTAVLPLFILGAVVIGLGGGLMFKTLLATVIAMAPPQNRGEVLAAFFFAAYVGLAVPVVAVGGLAELLSTQVLMTIFAGVAGLTLALSARALTRAGQRTRAEAAS